MTSSMQASGSGRFRLLITQPLALPFNPWWVLWVAAVGSPWLVPNHYIPWRGFQSDLLMTLALLPAAFWAVLRSPRPLPLSPSVIVALLTACIPPLQFAGGVIYFAGDAWMASAYLCGFALVLLVGARFEQLAPGQLANALFAAMGAAALLSTGLVLYQWLGLSGLGLLTFEFPKGYRPMANLGQSNNLATLLVWGLVALWWAYLTGRVRGWMAWLAAAFVMFGIVAAQSRTGWLEVAMLGFAAVLYRRPLTTRRYAAALGLLAAFFVVLVLGWQGLNHALYLEAARASSDEMSPGLRPAAWRMFLDAVTQHPWRGWGWNQQEVAQYAVELSHGSVFGTFSSAHDLILDLWVQNGVLLGTLLALALALWLARMALRVNSAQACLLLLAVGALLIHALLEYPQNYAYFLFPAGLMMGALDVKHPARRVAHVRRWVAVVMLCLGVGITGWITVEYNIAARNLQLLRFEQKHIGPSRNSKPPDLLMLTQLRELLWFWRVHPAQAMSSQQLDRMRKVAQRYPSDPNLLIFAIALGLHGHPDEAHGALARMVLIAPKERRAEALAAWRSTAKSSPVLAAIKLPAQH